MRRRIVTALPGQVTSEPAQKRPAMRADGEKTAEQKSGVDALPPPAGPVNIFEIEVSGRDGR
jgi:hypothetical protein